MAESQQAARIVVRKFRIQDYERVIELWEQGRLPLKPSGRDSREMIAHQICQPNVFFLVAEIGGRIIGTVLATHDGRKGWINRLAVDAAFRRKGIGRRLVLEAEKRLEKAGLNIVACLIEDNNAVSMDVFRRLGYLRHPEILYFTKRKYPGV